MATESFTGEGRVLRQKKKYSSAIRVKSGWLVPKAAVSSSTTATVPVVHNVMLLREESIM